VTVAVPLATPVKVTVHLPVNSMQLAPTVPTAIFEETKFTVPVGVLDGVVVSVTVAVQVEVPAGTIVLGPQTTPVDVLSWPVAVTVTVAVALVLGL
jgi:hypothetical protein